MTLLKQHGDVYLFWCPGCKEAHPYHTSGSVVWQFNGDLNKPTFTPSLMVDRGNGKKCHLFVREGMIQFCADCSHELSGQTVPMVDWDIILKEDKMDEETKRAVPDPTTSATAPGPGGPVLVKDPTVTAAADKPAAPPASPVPDFDQAVSHLLYGGFTKEVATQIVNHVGIEAVLAAKAIVGTPARHPAFDSPSPFATGEQREKDSSNQEEKQEGPPEPGMKRCPSCRTWYPGGYENCPQDNARLQ